MTLKELYEKINGSYDDAIGRLMKDSLIERFVLMYLRDDSFNNLLKAIETGNISEEFRAAHTLKGVAANLAFTNLQVAASNLTEQLRSQTEQANPELVETVKVAQDIVLKGIEEFQSTKN